VSDGLRLVLVRHGVTEWNREGRFQGRLDPALSGLGRRQASLVAERIAGDPELRPFRLITSTLVRAADTAAAIGAACGVDPEPEGGLVELGQGEWEGRTHAELARADAERYNAWLTTDREPPGAETVVEGLARVAAVLDSHARGTGTICLVSHGGTLRLVARHLLRLEARRAWGMDVDNASISVIESIPGAQWRIVRWNDTAHVLGQTPTHVDEVEGHPLAL
jgi:broad specificity phosphatase PhoE